METVVHQLQTTFAFHAVELQFLEGRLTVTVPSKYWTPIDGKGSSEWTVRHFSYTGYTFTFVCDVEIWVLGNMIIRKYEY